MDTNNLSWRKKIARVLVESAIPMIDDYLRIVCRIPAYAKLSNDELAMQAAPQFTELILMDEEPLWPDLPDRILAEVQVQIIKRLRLKRGYKAI